MLPASSRFAMRLMNVGCHAVISKYLKVLYTNRISSLVKISSFRNTYQQVASIFFYLSNFYKNLTGMPPSEQVLRLAILINPLIFLCTMTIF